MACDLYPEFVHNLEFYKMVEDEHRVLIAVSGGPDSMALLHLFLRWARDRIGVFHLNHGFRETAGRDADLVRDYCLQHNLPVEICQYDVTGYIKAHRVSLEQGARQVRYKLMVNQARKDGYSRIALAHHADDQAETVLMRLLRGSGLAGLRGIPAVRGMFIRPLLSVYKDVVLSYCTEYGIPYVEDETNAQSVYTRNKVRNQLIPLLEREYNPKIKQHLVQLSEIVQADEEELQSAAREICRNHMVRENGQLVLDRSVFTELTVSMQRRVLRELVASYKGDLRRIEFKHIEAWREKLLERGTFEMQLPQVSVSATANHIFIGDFPIVEWPDTVLNVPSQIRLADFHIQTEFYEKADLPPRPTNAEDFDVESLELPLLVRRRRPGDVMQPFGGKGQTKVKQLMIDAHIPAGQRNTLPVIQDQKEIVWIPGVRRSEKGRIGSATRAVVRISFQEEGVSHCHI